MMSAAVLVQPKARSSMNLANVPEGTRIRAAQKLAIDAQLLEVLPV